MTVSGTQLHNLRIHSPHHRDPGDALPKVGSVCGQGPNRSLDS